MCVQAAVVPLQTFGFSMYFILSSKRIRFKYECFGV